MTPTRWRWEYASKPSCNSLKQQMSLKFYLLQQSLYQFWDLKKPKPIEQPRPLTTNTQTHKHIPTTCMRVCRSPEDKSLVTLLRARARPLNCLWSTGNMETWKHGNMQYSTTDMLHTPVHGHCTEKCWRWRHEHRGAKSHVQTSHVWCIIQPRVMFLHILTIMYAYVLLCRFDSIINNWVLMLNPEFLYFISHLFLKSCFHTRHLKRHVHIVCYMRTVIKTGMLILSRVLFVLL